VSRVLASFSNVSVRFGGTLALDSVTCDLRAGAVTAVIGPNGSGKSTLLKALLGLVPHTGTVTLSVPRERIGYVPQRLEMERSLPVSVGGFLCALLRGRPLVFGRGAAGRKLATEVLSRVDAAHLADRPLGGLSGGELQRVLLALALEPTPELLLLDEPAAGMDFASEARLYEVIQDLVKSRGAGVVMVSHDLSVVSDLTDHVLCINQKLVCEGGPTDIFTDKNIASVFGHHHGIYSHAAHDHAAHDHAHSHHGEGAAPRA
jgi:zinc transport system ATP-binding protein